MSVDDMYPANQWRYHNQQQQSQSSSSQQSQYNSNNNNNNNQNYNQQHRQQRRAPMPMMVPMGMPMMMRPGIGGGGCIGPGLGMLGMMGAATAFSRMTNSERPPRRRRPPPPRRTQSQPTYPASMSHHANPVIVDVIKQGYLEIEYHILIKVYRKKWFVLKSDFKLYYFDSPQQVRGKPDGVINLLHVTALKKLPDNMLELEVSNKMESGTPVDLKNLITPDTTHWKLKCQSVTERNDWFDCIECFVSQNKAITYIEREQRPPAAQQNEQVEENKEDWCVVEKKEDGGIFSKILPKWNVDDGDDLDLEATAPEEPGMYHPSYDDNGNDVNGNERPPAYAPGYVQEYGPPDDENQANSNLYADEGQNATFQ
mmetsp:Transcript_48782/g.77969  ORF Transcript_48782/g.77969 Transcript_48782/m.77969 type:complete len:370 (+) Transcript_48782:26-1135(+)